MFIFQLVRNNIENFKMRVPEANHFHKPVRNDKLSATRLWSQPHPRAQCPVYNSQFAIVRSPFIVALQLLSLPVKTYVLWHKTETIMIVVILSIMADKSMESNSAFILFWKLKKKANHLIYFYERDLENHLIIMMNRHSASKNLF